MTPVRRIEALERKADHWRREAEFWQARAHQLSDALVDLIVFTENAAAELPRRQGASWGTALHDARDAVDYPGAPLAQAAALRERPRAETHPSIAKEKPDGDL